MPGESNFGRLYDALKTDHRISTDLSREDFISAMEAPGDKGYHNRLGLFNSLKTDGITPFNTYEEFAAGIGLHAVSKPKANVGNKDTQVRTSAPTKNQSRQQQQKKQSQNTPLSREKANAMAAQVGNMLSETRTSLHRTQNKLDYAKANRGLNVSKVTLGAPKGQVRIGQNNKVVVKNPSYNPETGKFEQTYITESGNEYSDRNAADMEQNQLDMFHSRMMQNGLDPTNKDDVQKQAQLDYEAPMRKAIEDEWQRAEAEDRAADEAYRKDMERAEGGGFWDRLKKSITPLGPDGMPLRRGDETLRDIKRAAKRQDTFNLEKMAQSVLQNMPQEYKDNQMLNYSRYFREHPSELKGRTVSQAAKEALQGEVYHAIYERAMQARMPKSKTEFLLRKVADQPFFSQTMADNMSARLFSHSIGTEAADMDAMGKYGTDHRALGITGTVLNMAIDPTTYISGGVGSFAGKQALKLSGKVALKGASKEAAERYVGRTLAGRMVAGVAAGSANFGTFEGLKNMQQQMRLGGTLNPETGEYEFSAGDILKATGHGMLLGSVTGTLSPVLGNVSDKLVKATESTAGKVGIRAGELMTSTVAEGTIFATPEWIENAQLADDDPRKRKAMDIWTDNMAMMIGFKVSHGIKSAPQVIAGLRPIAEPKTMEERNHNRRSFAERLRKRMDASPRDLDFTKEERDELKRNGYGDLASLFTRTPKQSTKPKAKPTMTDGKTMTFDVDFQHAEAERVSNPEFDGYEAMERLIQDPNVSQSARAKAYYILTGRQLPMGSVTGYTTEQDENGNIFVKSVTANGEVVTSRRFADEASAKKEQDKIMRQAELNTIDIGERYKEQAIYEEEISNAISILFPEAENKDEMIRYYFKSIEALKDPKLDAKEAEKYRTYVDRVNKAIEWNKSLYDRRRPEGIREDIKKQTGIDVDKVLQKLPNKRTKAEQDAVQSYVEQLYPAEHVENSGYEKKLSYEEAINSDDSNNDPTGNSPIEKPTDNNPIANAYRQAQEDVERRTHKQTRLIHPAVLKNGKNVCIVSGDVTMLKDGSGVDKKNSSDSIVVCDTETGELTMVSPDQIESVSEPVSPEIVGSVREAQIDDAYNVTSTEIVPGESYVDEEGNRFTVKAVDGDRVIITDKEGQEQTYEDGTFGQMVDGGMLKREADDPNATQTGSPEGDGVPTWGVGSRIEINGHEYKVLRVDEGNDLVSLEDENGKDQPIPWLYSGVKRALSDGRARIIEEKNDENKTLTDNQGNPINEDGTLKVEEVKSVDELTNDDFSAPTRNVQLPTLPKNVDAAIGAEGKPVVIKKNILEKNKNHHKDLTPEQSKQILEEALYSPNLYGQNQSTTRPYNWILIHNAKKHSSVIVEVNHNKDNVEIVNWHYLDDATLERKKRQAVREGGLILTLESAAANTQNDLSSADKDTEQYSTTQAEAQENAPMPMRTVGKGKNAREEEDWLATSPERGHDYIFSESGLDAETANTFVENKLLEAKKSLDKVKKNEPKIGTSIAEYKAAKQEHDARVAEAQKEVDYWNDVKAVHAKRAFEAENPATEDSAALAVDSAHQVDERISQKWNDANKIDGDADEITLPNGESVKGHYVLTESGAASASHQATNGFAETEGFPVDENGQSVNDRDYKRDNEAQEVTRSMASDYDSRALQSPVVVSREGVVLSGNGRTMAGEIAAQNGTDKKYNDYLRTHANKYGFTEEQVNGFEHPRLLFVPEADMPYTAETFAKFNQREQKSQNKTEQAVKMGKVVDDALFGRVMQTIGTYDTLGEFYGDDAATHGVVKELAAAGVIPQTEMAQLFDGGKLSEAGQAMVDGVLIGKVFQANPDAVREITEVKSMRQSVMAALQEIVTNSRLGGGYDLSQELAKAIDLVYKARKAGYKAGMRVSEYAGQGNLFQLEDGATVADYTNAAVMMLSDVLNDGRTTQLKKVMAFYNRQAADAAQGIGDMFAGGVKTKEEIINEVNEALNNGQNYNRNAAPTSDGQSRGNKGGKQGDVAIPSDQVGERGLSEAFDGLAAKLKSADGEERMRVLGEMRDGIARFAEENGYPVPEFLLTREDFLAAVPEKDKVRVEQWLNDGWHCPAYYEKGKVYYFVEGCDNFDKDVLETLSHEYTHADNADFPENVNALVYAVEDTHEVSQDELIDILETLSNSSHYGEDAERLESGGKNPNKMLSDEVIAHAVARMSRDGVQVLDGITKNPTLQFIIKRAYKVRENERRHNILASETSERSSKTIESSEANSGNSQSVAEGESRLGRYGRSARSEAETGEQSSNGRSTVNDGKGVAAPSLEGAKDGVTDGEKSSATGDVVPLGNGDTPLSEKIATASAEVNTEPTEAQKEAGNYKKGHVQVGTFDITIEQPQGSVRKGTDADGKQWESRMNNTYGYIRGAVGVDGDHIDVFLSNDIDGWNGRKVFVVDQYNPDGSFDEHKVMLGFNDADEAKSNYLANYENGWENGRRIDVTAVNLEDFEKWIESSKRKTKPFGEYAGVKKETVAADEMVTQKYSALPEDLRQQKADGKSAQPPTREETILRDAVIDHMKGSGLDVFGTEEGQRVLDMANGRDVRLEAARHKSKEAEERDKQLRTQDLATALVTGKSEQQARAERRERERKFKEETKELYDRVLSGNFDDVTLRLIDDYISKVTPNNYYGRPLSKRLPKRALSKMRGGEQAGSVDALFSRICEGAVGANERTRPEAKRRIEEKKKELLKGWAIATGNWHTSVNDFTNATEPFGGGKDSDVYMSDDGNSVIKVSKGKDNLKRFRPDMDNVALFNYVFPGNSYDIVGYGEIDGKFVRFLRQPFVDFTDSTPLSVEERVAYMEHLGFKPMNDEKTAFTNGEIVASDIQGNNIVKDKQGNIRVIDADMRFHTKDVGGKYTYPPVEKDTELSQPIIREHRVYHGSGAEFDAFDHSHMGEGEGSQSFGWGTYVTNSETIGKSYAKRSMTGSGLKRAELESNISMAKEQLPFVREEVKEELEAKIRDWETQLENLDESRHLYTVEIPEDNGKNYLDWNAKVGVRLLNKVNKHLEQQGKRPINPELDKRYKFLDGNDLYRALSIRMPNDDATFNDDKAASEFLSSLGFVGIKYPAGSIHGGVKEGDTNYVIFNEKDAKITDHVRFFRTANGEAYGFTFGGKIYIDPKIANSETPVHEYAHLWASALKANNPKEWQNVVNLMKGTSVWEEVKKAYPELKTDDEIADEVLATYSGRRGAERLREEAKKISDGEGSVFDKAKAVSALERVRQAIDKFWKAVADFLHIHYTSAEQVADQVMKDLLNGVDPRKFMGEKAKKEKMRYQFIGEQGAERADHAEEVTTRLDNLSVAREMEVAKKDAKAIKLATGWERGADGKWRYEIPDLKYFGKGDAGYKNAREKQPWSKELDGLSDRIFDGEELSESEYQRFDELAQEEENFKKDYLNREKPHLADWVENDELFKAYPDLKRVKLVFTDQLPANHGGSYNERDHTIVVNTNYVGDIASVLAHEVQHAIQKIEGFAVGGSPKSVRYVAEKQRDYYNESRQYYIKVSSIGTLADYIQDGTIRELLHSEDESGRTIAFDIIRDGIEAYKDLDARFILDYGEYVDPDKLNWADENDLKKLAKALNIFYGKVIDEEVIENIRKEDKLQQQLDSLSDMELYKRLGGEVESRNVEHRMNMTPEERKTSLAAETEDVSREDQIFLMSGDGGNANSEMPQESGTEDDYSEFAKEHGVDADVVKDYASGMKTGNLQKADMALAEIRRTMRVANRGMKLSEFGKLFRPVQKELAERYGDIETLRQEHIDATMRERGVMEAARKRAEEEEAKRKAHLEEMSLLTTEELDKRYFDAIESGEDAAAREMLDEAARRKGYDDTESNYQGVGAWSAPSNPGYESDAARRADVEDNAPDVNIEDIALGYSLVDEKYWQEPRKYMQTDATAIESVNAIREAIAAVRRGEKNVKVKVYRAVPTSVKEGKLRNGDWVTPSKDYAKMHGEHRLEGKYRIIEDEVSVDELWWDGNDSREWGFDNGKGYKYKNVKNNRKLNDLVTRDDNGEIIAPSKRFDENVEDVRYRETEPKTLKGEEALTALDNIFNEPTSESLPRPLSTLESFREVFSRPIRTFLGELVKVKDEVFNKIIRERRANISGAILSTVENADFAIRDTDGSTLYVKRYKSDNSGNTYNVVAVNKHGEVEDYVSSVHIKRNGNLRNKIKNGAELLLPKERNTDGTLFRNNSTPAAKVGNNFGITQHLDVEKSKAATDLAKQLHVEGDVEVVTTTEGLTGRQAKAKGWYDVKTGKVTIVLPNNKNAADVRETVFHEVVTHKGLRSLVGDENFNTFLDNIYNNAEEKIQQSIDELSQKYGGDKRKATEEYMAGLAEDGEFAKPENQSFFRKVKDFLVDLLRKVGIKLGFKLTDNDLRYILWRSWKNLKSGGRESLFDKAEDVVKQNELGQTDEARSEHGENGLMMRDGDEKVKSVVDAVKGRLERLNEQKNADRDAAVRAIGGSLRDLHKAMREQRTYDLHTVDSITHLAKDMLKHGLLHGLSDYEASRLFSAATNVHGKKDIKPYVQKVMDIMVNNQLHNLKDSLSKLLMMRGKKVNASGVEVQGGLDLDGQHLADTIWRGIGMTEEDIQTQLSEAQNRMDDENKVIAHNASVEYQAYQILQNYHDGVVRSKSEEQTLRDELKKAKEDYDAKRMSFDDYVEFREATANAIRENRMDRIEAYRDVIAELGGEYGESAQRAKDFREREKERINEIHHNANSDMEGRPCNEHHQPTKVDKAANNPLLRFLTRPMGTFDQMMRMFGRKNVRGEGYLWNRYMRGWNDARDNEVNGYRGAIEELDNKVKEVFGRKGMKWSDLFAVERKLPKGYVAFMDGGVKRTHELSQGNLMYIYMVNKMTDGKMKLRKMGISEEDVEQIADFLDPRLKLLGDWLQDEFLVKKREKYNEVHERLFGASMADIENYFPLKILKNAIAQETNLEDRGQGDEKLSTIVGSVKKRTRNALPLDVMDADAFAVVLDHIKEMEHFAAFGEWNRDLNTLLSYNRFRVQVQNMASVYGSGKELWQAFEKVCQIAAGVYRKETSKTDKFAMIVAKGVTGAKVTARIFTAFKQLTSYPAYLSEANLFYLIRNLINPVDTYKAWKWSMENLPQLRERWKGRFAGDPILESNRSEGGGQKGKWERWRENTIELAAKYGMSPNAFVDALTISMGTKAVYDTRLAKYKKMGYSDDAADKRAKQDASIAYNQTQQSSEGAYMSAIQSDRTWLTAMVTAFRNSSISYTRQLYDAMRRMKDRFTPGYKGLTVEFMRKQMERDGIDPDKASEYAKKEYRRGFVRDMVRVGVFGFLLPFTWNLVGYAPYLLFGDDDKKKKEMWSDIFTHTIFGSIEGLVGGDALSAGFNSLWRSAFNGEKFESNKFSKDMPVASDIDTMWRDWKNKGWQAGVTDVFNILVQSAIGVNPQTLTDAAAAIYDFCGADEVTPRECALLVMRIFNCPKSQTDKVYFDELGMTAKEAQKLSVEQIAERYADYKMKSDAPLLYMTYDDEAKKKRGEFYKNKAEEVAKENASNEVSTKEIVDLQNEYAEMKKKIASIKALEDDDRSEFLKQMGALVSTPEYMRYQIMADYNGEMNKLTKKFLRAKTTEERKAVIKDMQSARERWLEMLHQSNAIR